MTTVVIVGLVGGLLGWVAARIVGNRMLPGCSCCIGCSCGASCSCQDDNKCALGCTCG